VVEAHQRDVEETKEANPEPWRLTMRPWGLTIRPWRLIMRPWRLTMRPWRLTTMPRRLTMRPWRLIEARPEATWNSNNYSINLCMTHDISIMRKREIISG
jgi:hypothetical protein